MKNWLLIGLTLCALVLLVPGTGYSLEIVYPADGTYVTRSDYVIIKAGKSPAVEGLIVELNGGRTDMIDISSPEYRAAFDDFLILQPEFDSGDNTVKVESYSGGVKISEASSRLFFLKDVADVPPSDYKPFVMHTPEKEQLCTPCHNMQPDKVELQSTMASQNPCASCHKRMLDKKYVHGPAGVFRCTYCHQPGSRPEKYVSRNGGDSELCNECHAEQAEKFKANAYVHGPVGAGLCLVCHDSHATDNPSQAVAPINEVCLGCHEGIEGEPHVARGVSGQSHPLSGTPDPSRDGRELTCTGCHDPHGGMSPNLFVKGIRSRFSLCGQCHKK